MYKVVIVDDEEIIVRGLQSVVNWNSYKCEVVATAFDGISGAIAVRTYLPDILITDIKMPNRDGLTMLAGLRSEFPAMQVTILTGYADFDFAQKAIKLGVSRLLLKPSRMSEINEALQFMTDTLAKRSPAASDDKIDDLSTASANSFIVRQALAYIEENFSRKLTLQDVADYCYVSQWHLSKLLNKVTGQSFYDLLNKARIDAAKRLLEDPKLRISDISEMVGYTDNGHFSRLFKKMVGISANDYRNQVN